MSVEFREVARNDKHCNQVDADPRNGEICKKGSHERIQFSVYPDEVDYPRRCESIKKEPDFKQ